jgi:hypothetical protein
LSYILSALRKAESEREASQVGAAERMKPTYQYEPSKASNPGRNTLLAVVLILVVVVPGYWFADYQGFLGKDNIEKVQSHGLASGLSEPAVQQQSQSAPEYSAANLQNVPSNNNFTGDVSNGISAVAETTEKPQEPLAAYTEPSAAYTEPSAAYKEPSAAYKKPLAKYDTPSAPYKQPLAKSEPGSVNKINDDRENSQLDAQKNLAVQQDLPALPALNITGYIFFENNPENSKIFVDGIVYRLDSRLSRDLTIKAFRKNSIDVLYRGQLREIKIP